MMIIDKPYVSDFLKDTISKFQIPVVKTKQTDSFNLPNNTNFITEKETVEIFRKNPRTRIYTNSENAINWISKNLDFIEIPEKINLFKDKFLFRELTKDIYPNFFYQSLKLEDFDSFNVTDIPKPFIIKPSVGFFSLAVHKVNNDEEWEIVKNKIREELKTVANIYPKEVMDTSRFIIEEIITGDEFAFDAYYDANGEPFVLNVMQHVFSSADDFSDRLYLTSEKIIREQFPDMECFLRDIGMFAKLKNFPLHVEVRVDTTGKIIPIEINPLRFGAWCTTADTTWYAYNFNSIVYYLQNKKPDWNKLLENKVGKNYAMMVLQNSTGYDIDKIKSFNYNKLLTKFEKPIELREIDYKKYKVFGFLFVESRVENYCELEYLLHSDLREFIELY